ncbi:helix-hairpin-helix domain-containing protein [uncultured Prevotella sp.]|uniref:helix-hairpin-helix domain-containing protein n=1 Tax=uncultured Prevotella sp. TaxID=159272 RepID=UPI0025997AA2|nr:helix-hairpin-helix domain-containing protein [uncultured Prevotella sp.]
MPLGDFFYFTKSDRIATIFIVSLVIILAVTSYFVVCSGDDFFVGTPADSTAVAGGKALGAGEKEYYNVEGRKAELFPFDPNTADSTQLLRLGLSEWMVRNIYRYRASGGVYREPKDFARLYGLTVKQYRALEPYIRISADYRPASELYADDRSAYDRHGSPSAEYNDAPPRDTLKFPRKLRPGETVPLNTSDTTLLKRVPGIGSGYAIAIVRKRERLGGFYSARQLLEIDGLPEQALQYVSVDEGAVTKLNINKLSFSKLRQHPYINYYQARDIVDYRRLRGDIKSLRDLRLLKSFTPADIERLSHYVSY